jgi:hypothetical protein
VIFSSGLHVKVLNGTKSETRRLVKPGEDRCRYKVGTDYAVQAQRGGRAQGRLRILAIERQRVGDITEESVRREGFKTREDFEAAWRELHGAWEPEREVWAIVFVPLTDQVRLLAKDSSRGYTHDPRLALQQEPEAVDEEFTERNAREREEEFGRPYGMDAARAERSLAERVAELEPHLRPGQRKSIERRVESLERAVHEEAAA